MDFNKIVKNLLRKRGKLLSKDDIFSIVDSEMRPVYQNKVNKIIYSLRAKNIISPLKAGIYIVLQEEDDSLHKIDLQDKYYFLLLKKIISNHVKNNYYISGIKSLEFHLKNYEIPEKILIINRTLNKKIILGNKEIIFKTISGKIKQGVTRSFNIYSQLSKFTTKKIIEGIDFRISCLELSLLESAIIQDTYSGCDIFLLSKAIKKYGKVFDFHIFESIGKYKYITSFNRLKELSKPLNTELYLTFLNIIKCNGGLFIGAGIRRF